MALGLAHEAQDCLLFTPPRCSQDLKNNEVLSNFFSIRKEHIPFTASEDCLYLNIYTPADLSKKSRLPVSGA